MPDPINWLIIMAGGEWHAVGADVCRYTLVPGRCSSRESDPVYQSTVLMKPGKKRTRGGTVAERGQGTTSLRRVLVSRSDIGSSSLHDMG